MRIERLQDGPARAALVTDKIERNEACHGSANDTEATQRAIPPGLERIANYPARKGRAEGRADSVFGGSRTRYLPGRSAQRRWRGRRRGMFRRPSARGARCLRADHLPNG